MIFPFVIPVGTITVSCVVVADETDATAPLNFTLLEEVVVLKFVPFIITCSPAAAETGEKLVIVGAGGVGVGVGELLLPHPVLNKIKSDITKEGNSCI